jgi:hypothetical protein
MSCPVFRNDPNDNASGHEQVATRGITWDSHPWEHLSALLRHLGRFQMPLSGYRLLPPSFIIVAGASRGRPSIPSESMPTASPGLPQDIWGEIAEQLSAFDVFSLSQVRIVSACRTMTLKGHSLLCNALGDNTS